MSTDKKYDILNVQFMHNYAHQLATHISKCYKEAAFKCMYVICLQDGSSLGQLVAFSGDLIGQFPYHLYTSI